MSRFGRDYLKVGMYTEIMFPDMDVHFVAIYDGVDSTRGDNEFTAIRNIFNEMHVRDTSKKVRAVIQSKGMAGEYITSLTPYGYLKAPEDKKRWIVDEVAAEVVRKIFRWCLAGLGPTHIAHKLRDERIVTPTVHMRNIGLKPNHKPPAAPSNWDTSTVVQILSRREYLGHTINFKCYRKSYKDKTVVFNDPSKYVVFENTHEAIIDPDTFDRVQELRAGKRRRAKSGRVELFSGIVFCADCGSKMYFSSRSSFKPEQDFYACSGFRMKKSGCCNNSHYVRAVLLTELVTERYHNHPQRTKPRYQKW